MRPLARKALEAIQNQGEEVVNFDLIESTLKEINQSYTPGLVEWVKVNRPDTWTEIRRTEERINQAALKGDIENLKDALLDYKELILGAVKIFETPEGQTGNLF